MRWLAPGPALLQPGIAAQIRQQFLIVLLWVLFGLCVVSNGDTLLAQERTRRVRARHLGPRWGGARTRRSGPLVAAACF